MKDKVFVFMVLFALLLLWAAHSAITYAANYNVSMSNTRVHGFVRITSAGIAY